MDDCWADEAAGLPPDMDDAVRWFLAYTAAFFQDGPCGPLELKIRHTLRVARLADRIVTDLGLTGNTARAARLAALLHDVGRFPQFRTWKTFRDLDSADHGQLGVRTLRAEHPLRAEPGLVRGRVKAAVALHNRYALPDRMDETTRLITTIVRDADKIDILRIFSEELRKPEPSPDVVLHVAREPERWTPAIAEMLMEGRIPRYSQLNFVNDFIMLLCTWPGSLHFSISLRLVREAGYIRNLTDSLPRVPALDPIRERAMALLRERPEA